MSLPMGPPDSEDPDCIRIYADGASSGNPGPSGIGVLLRYREHEKEISRNIGLGTNNIAELEAIRTGLLEVKNPDLPVRVYTDSGYAYGLLTLGWKARKNEAACQRHPHVDETIQKPDIHQSQRAFGNRRQ